MINITLGDIILTQVSKTAPLEGKSPGQIKWAEHTTQRSLKSLFDAYLDRAINHAYWDGKLALTDYITISYHTKEYQAEVKKIFEIVAELANEQDVDD